MNPCLESFPLRTECRSIQHPNPIRILENTGVADLIYDSLFSDILYPAPRSPLLPFQNLPLPQTVIFRQL